MKQSLYYTVPGARRLSNYIWGAILTIGGIGFLLTGLSCYFNFALYLLLKLIQFNFFLKV
jgi:hypothetical protein